MSNLYIPMCGLFCAILLTICFFSKERIENKDTKLFKYMIITSLIDSICMVFIILTAYFNPKNEILLKILNKIDYIQFLIWFSTFFLYIFHISTYERDKENKIYNIVKKYVIVFNIVFGIIILLTQVKLFNEGNTMYSYGDSCNILYIASGCYFILIIFAMLSNVKKIFSKKYIPFFVLIIMTIFVIIMRSINPGLVVISAAIVYVNLIMYFTIENPDVKMLEEVTIAKETAERANRAKTDFLSSMSHEIRTPLNAIVGFSECILEEHDMKKVKNDAKDIIMASQNLLEIVNGILDISKIEADKMEINSSEYSLVNNMNNIAKLMIPRIGEKPILLKTKFAKDIPDVLYGDIGKIKQIVTNLLTNAVKYTDKGIINFEINCLNKGGVCTLVISVEDTGRGIKPEKIDSIFNKFERLEEDRNTTLEGTGLGLAITKRMAEMMGGKVVVQSKYGSGSKFTVYLKQKIVNKPATLKEEVFNSNEKFDCSGKRVLVVDDNNINLKVAVRLLEPFKMYITTCQSGQECIDMANRELFDLILLDDMMPGLTGKETLVKLQENPNFNVPVVALTANAIEGMKEEYLKLGFNDYLAKPIDKLELERVLRKLLGDSKDVMKNTFEPLPNELFDMNIPLKK